MAFQVWALCLFRIKSRKGDPGCDRAAGRGCQSVPTLKPDPGTMRIKGSAGSKEPCDPGPRGLNTNMAQRARVTARLRSDRTDIGPENPAKSHLSRQSLSDAFWKRFQKHDL